MVVLGTRDVYLSADVARVLKKVGTGQTMILCGRDFTEEARDLCRKRGVLLAARACFGWTDERYIDVKENW